MREGTGLVGKGETKRGLVYLLFGNLQRIIHYEETREIVLVGLDLRSQDFKAVLLRGNHGSHGADPFQALSGNLDGASGRIFRLHKIYPGTVGLEEIPGLVDGHVMRTHLADVLDLLPRKGHKILVDGKIHLTLNLLRVFPE